MKTITFFAFGEPKGQPRPRAFAMRFGDKYQARVYDAGTAEGWKSQVAIAAKEAGLTKFEGPIRLDLEFVLPRPRGHFRTGKLAGQLRADAPNYHVGKPDKDNLDKAVMDALTVLGAWNDDGQVCDGRTIKRYGCPTGVRITIKELENAIQDPEQPLLLQEEQP